MGGDLPGGFIDVQTFEIGRSIGTYLFCGWNGPLLVMPSSEPVGGIGHGIPGTVLSPAITTRVTVDEAAAIALC
jgi:hypothetical protein